MAFEHVNRKRCTYFLVAGKTKSGKPKYFFTKKMKKHDVGADAVPEGYEVYEKPENAQVFLRKIKATKITAEEKRIVETGIREYSNCPRFLVEIEGNDIVVYTSDVDAGSGGIASIVDAAGFLYSPEVVAGMAPHAAHYQKTMRFSLVDEKKRIFWVARWCFLGSIDTWLPLSGRAPLKTLVPEYTQHLGEESFYHLC